jgi:23S rRNA (guanine745-N1)-methyltransferase
VHAEVVTRLRCPVCQAALAWDSGLGSAGPAMATLRCARGHSFDQAKQGYAQLTAKPLTHTGDTPEMAAARDAFLRAGHFDRISDAIAVVASQMPHASLLVDAGGGTGYHVARVLDAVPQAHGLALDASKACARRAARAHPRMDSVVCDVWQPLPVVNGGADLIMNVFAPRTGAEFARILHPGGRLVSVTPQTDHLAELIEPLRMLHVDESKSQRVAGALDAHFTRVSAEELSWSMWLRGEEVTALARMGPSAWHVAPDELPGAVAALPDPVQVTASVRVATYRLR